MKGPTPRRLGVALLATTFLIATPASAQTASSVPAAPAEGGIGRASGQLDTIDTLAGPGFCDGPTLADVASTAVGALVADKEGTVLFDTGPAQQGTIARVEANGITQALEPGVAVGPDPFVARVPGEVPAASRLASDSRGNALVNAGTKVLRASDGFVVAGGGPAGAPAQGDGGPALASTFASIRSIATDKSGNLYVADQIDPGQATVAIRFVNRIKVPITFFDGTPQQITIAPGNIDTIAGAAIATPPVGGEPARAAVIQGIPPAMSVSDGLLYIASYWPLKPESDSRATVRVVNLGGHPAQANGVTVAPGAIETVAGGEHTGFAGDGGQARAAAFGYLPGIAADGGNLYLADEQHQRVRRVDAQGVMTTIAGMGGTSTGDGGFNGNNRPAATARLDQPYDVKVDGDGQVYISDRGNSQVRFIDSSGLIRAAPGQDQTLTWTCAPVGTVNSEAENRLRPGKPGSVAVDDRGVVYFDGAALPQVKRIDGIGVVGNVAGYRSSQVCAPPSHCPTDEGRPAAQARFVEPSSIAVAGQGLYVLDTGNHRVRYVNLTRDKVHVNGVSVGPGLVETIAGNGAPGAAGDGKKATDAELSGAGSILVDRDGGLLIADTANARVRRVDAAGVISTVDGTANNGTGCCPSPTSVALDKAGNLYVADNQLHQVWFLNRGPSEVTVHGQAVPAGAVRPVAGNGSDGFGGDGGQALDAQMKNPAAVAISSTGNLYIADAEEHTIRRVDPSGVIVTVAGTGSFGFNGDGLPGALTALNSPLGLAFDRCGNLLIGDSDNDRVRRLNLVGSCTPITGAAGGGGFPWLAVAGLVAVALVGTASTFLARGRRNKRS